MKRINRYNIVFGEFETPTYYCGGKKEMQKKLQILKKLFPHLDWTIRKYITNAWIKKEVIKND